MAEPTAPWWRQVDDAARLITSTVSAAVLRAGRDGVYAPPPGAPPPRRRRQAASLRHLAEVIRAHRMAPGMAVDKDVVAGVLAGDLRHLSDPLAVVAVARASHHIAGLPFGAADAQRLTVAVAHLNALIQAAREADLRAPDLLPVPRPGAELVEVAAVGRLPQPVHAPGDLWPPPRRARWFAPAAGVVLLVVFAAGILVGIAGSRQAGSSGAAGAAPRAATPTCQPSGAPRPSGPPSVRPPGAPAPPTWWANVVTVGLTPSPTGFVATVPVGSTTPSELIAIRSGVTLTAGHRYRFDFTATGDRPVDILLRIQDKTPPLYRPSLVEAVPIGKVPCRRSYTFTAAMTSPATGEVTFQLGGQGAYTVTVDDAVLVDTGA